MDPNVNTPDSSWIIYILRCKDGSLYTGICRDIKRRLHEHNNLKSGARYTRTRRPVKLVYLELAPSRSAAAQREYRIKLLTPEQKRCLIRQQGIAMPDTLDTRVVD